MKQTLKTSALLALCLSLQGCLVASAVDLAATTVFTAGKLAVKGTGAAIDAAIPDKDKNKKEQEEKQPQQNQAAAQYRPVSGGGAAEEYR